MIIKLDFEKSYDRVDWDFLLQTLNLFGFPPSTVKLIRVCITSLSLAVLWNGERTDGFVPTRGLRHSDPLSPYLFILYLERFSMMIASTVEERRW